MSCISANEHTSSGVSCYDLLLCWICLHDDPTLSRCNTHTFKHFALYSAHEATLPESHIPLWSGDLSIVQYLLYLFLILKFVIK